LDDDDDAWTTHETRVRHPLPPPRALGALLGCGDARVILVAAERNRGTLVGAAAGDVIRRMARRNPRI